MIRIVVFASGSGSNFQSIINAVEAGKIPAHIVALISNRGGIKAIERAKNYNIPTVVLSENDVDSYPKYEKKLLAVLAELNPDLLILAGYLRKIPGAVIKKYPNRILNIHPSLLPKYGGKGFYGMRVHQAVIDAKETKSGCSIHIATDEYDKGTILAQATVVVDADDTPQSLAAKVNREELLLYPKVIANYIHSFDSLK